MVKSAWPEESGSARSLRQLNRFRRPINADEVFGTHMRSYARYYNEIRTHRSLNKDAPVSRAAQRTGIVKSHAILGGLHHHYVRI